MVEPQKIPRAGNHQYSREQKQEVAQQHNPAKPADNDIRSLIRLHELHGDKRAGTSGKHIGRPLPGQHDGTRPYYHQKGTQQVDHRLNLIELPHCLIMVLPRGHRR